MADNNKDKNSTQTEDKLLEFRKNVEELGDAWFDKDTQNFYAKLNQFVDNQGQDLAEKLSSISGLINDLKVGKFKNKKEFNKKLDEEMNKIEKDVKDTEQAIGDAAAKKAQDAIEQEAVAEVAEKCGVPEAEVRQVLDVDYKDKYELKRPDKEKIKQLYDYKVEGKIESGIKDLDNFLSLIQPAINQCIILAWKPIFGLMDVHKAAQENHEAWQKRKAELKEGWDTLQAMGITTKPFNWLKPIKDQEDEMALLFNNHMCKHMNATIDHYRDDVLREKKEEIRGNTPDSVEAQAKIDEYERNDYVKDETPNRTDLFDDTKDPRWSRYTIDDEFLNLLKLKDKKDGKLIARDDKGKITDKGKSLMKGYSVLLDLFNKKGKSDFYEKYVCDMEDLMKKANIAKGDYSLRKKYNKEKIEDIDLMNYMKEQDGEYNKIAEWKEQGKYYGSNNSR